MYIHQSCCIYKNLDAYIRILMYISLSFHVNNDVVVLSVFNKHTLILTSYYSLNLYANVQLVKHEPEFHCAKRDSCLSIQHMEVSASRTVHFIAKIANFG